MTLLENRGAQSGLVEIRMLVSGVVAVLLTGLGFMPSWLTLKRESRWR
jgi:hypothetical protein